MINPNTFIEDFRKLFAASPMCGSWTRASENCDYGDIITGSKDCYMCFNSGNCRDAYYCEDSRGLTNSSDCTFCENCELCYECTDCDSLYNCDFCQDCNNCQYVQFSYDLRRCKNCFGCVGLRNKEYCIFNEQYSREDYENASKHMDWGKFEALKLKTPRMFAHQLDTSDCSGDYIYHSKNCHMCFDVRHTEDSGYIYQANLDMGTRDSWDCGPIPTGMDLCYDIAYAHFLFNCKHLYWCGNLKDCEYCCDCFEGENLFGCCYMQKKRDGFYILNQKVEEALYKDIVPKIRKLLGERGIYTLYDLLHKDLSEEFIIIEEGQVIRNCTLCKDNFELIDKEIKFYEKHEIKFPIYCPNCRAVQRFKLRGERKMHKRKCNACQKTLISTFPADSKYTVYCLGCYWKHIN